MAAGRQKSRETSAVAALTGEVEAMVRDLCLALAEQRQAPQNTQ